MDIVMAEKMEVNTSVHIRVLYILMFGLYFGFFILLYCNNALWWKVESFDSVNRNTDDNSNHNTKISTENVLLNESTRLKRSRTFRSAVRQTTLQECAYLTNICKEQNLGLPALKGDKGDQGVRGDKGEFGIYGMTGPRGPPGTAGQPGRDGAKGDKGEKGHEGLLGFPGLKGETGPLGIKGDKGDRGIIGPGGPKGFGGPKGEIGEPGEDGIPGKRGRRGPDGLKGRKGIIGIDGPQGHTGPKGQKGENGELGVPGYRIACNCSDGLKGDTETTQLTPITTVLNTTSSTATKTTVMAALVTTKSTPTLPPRTKVRKLKMIGIPLFLRRSGPVIGSWIRDSALPNNYYVTYDFYGSYVYQYTSTENFKSDKIDRTHDLRRYHYYGNSHVVFNGSLYYHRSGESTIVRFDLTHGAISTVQKIHGASYNDSNYLYAKSHVYFDLEFDENGLWAIYRKPRDEKGLHIMKIDPLTMQNIKTWRLEVDPTEYGNGFIAGGILYLVRDITKTKSTLDYAYDLYTDKQYKVPTPMFRNPYKYNTMINYFPRNNARDSRLLAWDNGVQMEYALLF
ncbi:gliomedin-like isoform X3 [Mytilus trossulus]|uniref:gliomedin-like isoform X3 n=1 Tax=Mytilus trossulus TaxID=6551 RepID=UPI003006D001